MILLNDFKAEPVVLREAMLSAVRRVLESGWFVLGPEVQSFEEKWLKTCGVAHAVGVANGMDAIEIALRSLNIGPGDEVVTTPMTAFATVLAVLRSGATPVLADIDAGTGLMSLDSVKRCLSSKTKAILLVHLYGQVRNMDLWLSLCSEAGVVLIEDCAQAHLSVWRGQMAGCFGVAGAYSFYPTKNLGAPGDAGILVTNTAEIAERAFRLRNYGQSVRYYHPEIGMNSRLDEIHAAMLSVRLAWLKEFTERRRSIAMTYVDGIHNKSVQLLDAPQETSAHSYHLFVVTSQHRGALQAHLQANQVQALIHYPVPVHHQDPCAQLLRDPMGLPIAEAHAKSCLSLPCHPQMSDADVAHVIDVINSFVP